MRVRRFYPNHEYHPFPKGDSFVGVAKRCGEFKIVSGECSMHLHFLLAERSDLRRRRRWATSIPAKVQSQGLKIMAEQSRGRGRKRERGGIYESLHGSTEKGKERGRRRHKKHKKDFIGPSTRPTDSVCRFPTGLMRRDNVKRHPARSLARSELLTLLTRRLWETVECEEFQKSSAISG